MSRALSMAVSFLLAMLAASSVAASTVQISFHTHELPGSSAPTGTVRVLARVEGTTTDRELTLPLAGGTIALEPGLWRLSATKQGYWSESEVLNVADPGVATELSLFPSATIRGTIHVPAKANVAALTIHFQPSDEVSSIPHASADCAIVNNKIACEVPAGKLDLSLRAGGFVSLYRFNAEAKAHRELDLGVLELRRGSTLSGFVAFGEKRAAADLLKSTVSVWQDTGAPQQDDVRERAALRNLSVHVESRGFFHFSLAPGEYLVQAHNGDWISEPQTVRVVDGREAQLRDPLTISSPRRLTLRVDPPVDPHGAGWYAQLQRLDRNFVVVSTVTGLVPPSGEWQRDGLAPGFYSISIRRSQTDIWYEAPLEITSKEVVHEAKLELVHVNGTVQLGDRPLVATIWFGGDQGARRIPTRSRADGTFTTIVPADLWKDVDVIADDPFVRRTLHDIDVRPRNDGKPTEVNLTLPSNRITGVVVDPDGVPQRFSIVDVTTADGNVRQINSESGTFSISGLPIGRLALKAQAHLGVTTQPTEVDVTDSETPIDVRLVVSPRAQFTGIVQASNGPVSGAAVGGVPFALQYNLLARLGTDEEGRFMIPLPANITDFSLLVAAPGYAFRMARAHVDGEVTAVPSQVPVSLGGGTFIGTAGNSDTLLPCLIHNGAVVPLFLASWFAQGQVKAVDGGQEATLYPIEEGSYSLCWLGYSEIEAASNGLRPPDRCVSGVLPIGGTLTLALPAQAKASTPAPSPAPTATP